jgi:hypothetical protein
MLQHRGRAHCTPAAGKWRILALAGRFRRPPGCGRRRGLGNSPSFARQPLQYTVAPPLGLYHKEPQLSQTFKSTNSCIVNTPWILCARDSCFRSRAKMEARHRARRLSRPGCAVRVGLVFCHRLASRILLLLLGKRAQSVLPFAGARHSLPVSALANARSPAADYRTITDAVPCHGWFSVIAACSCKSAKVKLNLSLREKQVNRSAPVRRREFPPRCSYLRKQ